MRRSTGPTVSLFSFQDIITAVMGILILIALLLALKLVTSVAGAADASEGSLDPTKMAAIQAEVDRLRQEKKRLERDLKQSQEIVQGVDAISQEELRSLRKRVEALENRRDDLMAEVEVLREQHDQELRLGSDEQTALRRDIEQLDLELAQVENELKRFGKMETITFNIEGFEDHERFMVDLGQDVWRVTQLDRQGGPTRIFDISGSVAARHSKLEDWLSGLSPSRTYIFLLLRPSMRDSGYILLDVLRTRGFARGFEPLAEDQDFTLGRADD